MRIIPSQEELQRWSGYIYGVPSLLEIVAVMESVEEAIEESNVWRISRSNMLRGFQIPAPMLRFWRGRRTREPLVRVACASIGLGSARALGRSPERTKRAQRRT
jgi:hypothetical protein